MESLKSMYLVGGLEGQWACQCRFWEKAYRDKKRTKTGKWSTLNAKLIIIIKTVRQLSLLIALMTMNSIILWQFYIEIWSSQQHLKKTQKNKKYCIPHFAENKPKTHRRQIYIFSGIKWIISDPTQISL